MNTLRKKPTYYELIHFLNNQPTIKYPARKGLRVINNPIISNLLYDDEFVDDMIFDDMNEIISQEATQMMKKTQTRNEQGAQTDSLEKGTQRDYEWHDDDEGYRRNPHFYTVHPAFSKQPWDYDYFKSKLFKRSAKNNAYSESFDTQDNNLKDTGLQTSTYIPGSLAKKRDNINQTIRYELRLGEPYSPPPSEKGDPSEPPSEKGEPTDDESPNYYKKPSPSPTPLPTPPPTRKPTPPQSEYEDEEELDSEDEFLRRYGYMAWYEKYFRD